MIGLKLFDGKLLELILIDLILADLLLSACFGSMHVCEFKVNILKNSIRDQSIFK